MGRNRTTTFTFNCVNVKTNIPQISRTFSPLYTVIQTCYKTPGVNILLCFSVRFSCWYYKHLKTPAASAEHRAVLMLKRLWEKLAADCVDWTTTAPAHLTSKHGQVLCQLLSTLRAALAASSAAGKAAWKQHLCHVFWMFYFLSLFLPFPVPQICCCFIPCHAGVW